MSLRLTVFPSADESYTWSHPGPCIAVGRSPEAELRLQNDPGQTISWMHARIEITPEGTFVSDLTSTNGTFLNDERITQRTPLQNGDCIRLGSKGLKLVVEEILPPQAIESAEPIVARNLLTPLKPPVPPNPVRLARVRVPRVVSMVSVMLARSTTRWSTGMPWWLNALCVFGVSVPLALLVAALVVKSSNRPTAAPIDQLRVANTFVREPVPEVIPTEVPPLIPVTPAVRPTPQILTAKTDGATVPGDSDTRQVKEVLTRYCHRCHGDSGSNEGGFNFVLNRSKLLSSGYVHSSASEKSRLLQRVISGEMPPAGEDFVPTKSEISLLKQWIDAGAAEFNPRAAREFIATQAIFQAISRDLQNANERDRQFRRYFSIAHLANSGSTDDELQTYRNALAKLVNSLSWRREIVIPKSADTSGTVLRIDLRDYDWSAEVWDGIAAVNPYTVIYDSPLASECYQNLGTKVPYLHADWFVFKASRPPLYEKVLRLPSTDLDLEQMLMVSATRNIRQETAVRAGFNASGVSQHNRMIERHESTYGAYWKSYDFASSTGRQNLFQHPLGPAGTLPAKVRSEPFAADGGELIFNLPNGLQAYFLVDGKGRRIERGPVQIVSDPKQPDRSVVNGISCMSCHYAGIIKKGDEIRNHILANRSAFPEADDILALYRPREDMETRMTEDAERFRLAVEKTGTSISQSGEPVVNIARKFEQDLDLATAAAEVGSTADQFKKRIEESAVLRRMLGPLLVEGGTLKRQVYVESFAEIVRILQLSRSLKASPAQRF